MHGCPTALMSGHAGPRFFRTGCLGIRRKTCAMNRIVLVASVALIFAGCAEDVCERSAEVNDAVADRAAGCAGVSAGGHVTVADCDAGRSTCTSEDLEALSEHLDCLEKID